MKEEDAKKKKLIELEYHFEFLVEHFEGSWGPPIELKESRDIQYLIKQLVKSTGAPEEKIIEGIENWMSGINRKYG